MNAINDGTTTYVSIENLFATNMLKGNTLNIESDAKIEGDTTITGQTTLKSMTTTNGLATFTGGLVVSGGNATVNGTLTVTTLNLGGQNINVKFNDLTNRIAALEAILMNNE